MESEALIQKQLLYRALSSPYFSVEIIGRNNSVLFQGNENYQIYGRILVNYYNVSKEPITEETFKLKLTKSLNQLNSDGDLGSDDYTEYYNEVNDIFNSKVDTSDTMTEEVGNYVRKKLGEAAILESARRSSDEEDFDLVKEVGERIEDINSLDISGQGNKVISVYEDYEEKNEIYKELARNKISMGIPSMDLATGGGLAKGEVGLIAARSGFGKTTTLTSFANSYTFNHHNVMYFSLEEMNSRMLLRFDRLALNKPANFILDKDSHLTDEYKRKSKEFYSTALDKGIISNLYLYRTSPHTITIDQIRQIILRVERQNNIKLDVVFIDYPDLLLDNNSTGNESQDGGRIFQDIRKMAQDTSTLIWTATQLNRGSGDQETMTLDNVEGSYRKKNTVEFAGTVNRTKDEKENGFLRIYIDKLRNPDAFDGDMLYFKYDKDSMRTLEEKDNDYVQHLSLLKQTESSTKESRKDKFEDEAEKRSKKAQMINTTFSDLP